MALTDEGGIPATMLVGPTGYGNNGGFGGFGGDWAWIILLLLAFGGGWGNGFGGFGGGGDLYPWMNNSQNINDGFRDQMMQTTITGISDKICNGFADVNAAITNTGINNMQQLFGVQSALQSCCCQQTANAADIKYTIATEACATRTANAQNTQAVLDKLCQLELDGVKRENDNLRAQLSDAKFAASQAAQNALIQKGLTDEVDALYNRLSNCPVPSTPVYGRTPIFTCSGNCGG